MNSGSRTASPTPTAANCRSWPTCSKDWRRPPARSARPTGTTTRRRQRRMQSRRRPSRLPSNAPPLTRARRPLPAPASDAWPTIAALASRLATGQARSEQLTEDALGIIAKLNPRLNAFITVTADLALARAREADQEIAAGRHRGPLHGIPISIKDIFDQAGQATTAGSRLREGRIADRDAPVVAHLAEAGAVFVGRTNLHEFALGTTTEDSGWGLGAESGRRHAFAGRIERRLGDRRPHRHVDRQRRHRYRRFDPHPRGRLRPRRAQAGLGRDLRRRRGAAQPAARSRRPARPFGRRCGDHVRRAARPAALVYRRGRCEPAAGCRSPRSTATSWIGSAPMSERVSAGRSRRCGRAARPSASAVDPAREGHRAGLSASRARRRGGVSRRHARAASRTPTRRMCACASRWAGTSSPKTTSVHCAGATCCGATSPPRMQGVDALLLPALAIEAPPIGAATVPVSGGQEPVRSVMLRCTQLFNVTGHPAISVPCGTTRDGSADRPADRRASGAHGRSAARGRRRRARPRIDAMISTFFHRWEHQLADVSKTRRVTRPFEWGLDWVPANGHRADAIRPSACCATGSTR